MKRVYDSMLCVLCMLACCHCQRAPFQPDTVRQEYFSMGKGGGMTNQVTTYYVLADGHVYQHNNLTKAYQHVGRLHRAARSECFEEAHHLSDSLVGFEQPGNLYYFLSLHTSDTVTSYTWGRDGFAPPKVITDFYQHTQQLINDLSP